MTVPAPTPTGQQNFEWNVANNYCFDNKGRPTSYASSLNVTKIKSVSWTGLCRSFIIYYYSDVTAAVGASVAAVFVIALVVVFVILRKRKKTPEFCKATTSSKDSNNHNGNTESFDHLDEKTNEYHSYDQIGGSFYQENADSNAEASSSDNYHAHRYFVLGKDGKETDNANETYDLAGAGKHTHVEERIDYNHVKIDNNETYDHAYNQNKEKNETHNETYDTTEKAAMKPKIRAANDLDAFGGTDENAYNHINVKLLNNSATDQVYNVPCQPETESSDVGNSPQKECQDGDTYSHIRNKPPKGNKADNLYGVPKCVTRD
ncbi:uncharacterized protein LOC128553076 isoform X2 [Mercenaria mercenaria]|uniref:uncharacterized protein LOC128553076 isoform X2 n=1 Tax=Mercenaria mercenaria TaxID=6596 RepID=UPI00234F0C2D|nr:uncharacterized protein LOC128553076 isoform X2 [Mercenaria mercenaria]